MRHLRRGSSSAGPLIIGCMLIALVIGSGHEQVSATGTIVDARRETDPQGSVAATSPGDPDAPRASDSTFLLPMVPRVDAEIAAALENERVAELVAETSSAVAAEQAAAEEVVRIHEDRLVAAGEDVELAEAHVARLRSALGDADTRLSRMVFESELQRVRTIGVAVDLHVLAGTIADPRYQLLAAVLNGSDPWEPSTMMVYTEFVSATTLRDLQLTRDAVVEARTSRDASAAELMIGEDQLSDARSRFDSQTEALDTARRDAEQVRAEGARRIARARQAAPVLPATQMTGGLSIVGEPLVSASDLAGFVRQVGRAHPVVDLDLLAELFIAEGRAEGIRSDVAWVQSILETGWFSYEGSMVLPTDNNYAGIGACDSCARGIVFASPSDGVRSQIQLLRTYATRGLRTSDLASPPPRLEPERSSVRGCCDTWMKLSGVWATGPGYGIRILTLYNQLLNYAAANRLR